MPSRLPLTLFALLTLNCASHASYGNDGTGETQRPPNIVLIFADDLGYGDVGCYGATKVSTPNIDRLASEGRLFTDAHAASAVCTPSRYSLLTGQYGWRVNSWGPHSVDKPLIVNPETMTVPRLLQQHGYATACIGKWHLGFGNEPTDWNKPLKPGPLELGFDYYFGVPLVNSGPPFVYVENHHVVGLDPEDPFVLRGKNDRWPPSPVQAFPAKNSLDRWAGARQAHELYRDEMVGTTLTTKAVDWIRAHMREKRDKPFFLYLATTNIHHPFTPHPRFQGTSQCGRYGDFIHELDWIVGEVLETIGELNVADNTLVIFTSDNGGMLNVGGQDAWRAGHRPNGELLGFKFGVWEGGHRVPFIARWPGKIPPNTRSSQLVSIVDMLGTFAGILGVSLAEQDGPDSFNQLPTLLGEPQIPVRDHAILAPYDRSHLAIRKGKWIYIPGQGSGGFQGKNIGDHTLGGPAAHKLTHQVNSDIEGGEIKQEAPPAQLYNLAEDLSQTKNVIRDYPEVAEQLAELLRQCKSQDRTASLGGDGLTAAVDLSRANRKSSSQSNAETAKRHPTSAGEASRDRRSTPQGPAILSVTFTYSDTPGIGAEAGVCRRDPSDVIRVGGTYYVYYTKVVRDALPEKSRSLYPSGYPGALWCATSNDEGRTWTEIGEVLGPGADGAFDSFGVFTPNILKHGGRFYLYYTGAKPTPTRDDGVFENNSTNDFTALGLAVSDTPSGPFTRIVDNPIMEVSDRADRFDSYRIDDACLLLRDGKVWLYYKGRALRHGKAGPRHTQMGVAIAEAPTGPYARQNMGNPVQDSGHEVLIWEESQSGGVMSLVSETGPNGRTMQIAADGLSFEVLVRDLTNLPQAPGLYRPKLVDPAAAAGANLWGISMMHGRDPYLHRFEIHAKR